MGKARVVKFEVEADFFCTWRVQLLYIDVSSFFIAFLASRLFL